MDDNEFFRQATLRICGNLEIEKALKTLLEFLKQTIPVDRLFLQIFDQDYGAMRTIAYASHFKCGQLDLLTPLSDEARDVSSLSSHSYDGAYFFENPSSVPICREMLGFHNVEGTSLIVIGLDDQGRELGSAVFISEGEDKLNVEHLRMLRLIKEPFFVAMSNAIRHQQITKLKDLLADDNRYLQGELWRLSGDEIIGANFGLKNVMYKARQVAKLDSPVLLTGETGVGKDVIANAIHYSSARSHGPFVSVNCGAIPEALIDSELFGHEKGAFTGAISKKRGRFERANKGTIFLDEVGELPLQAQVRLLRVLQSREIERVGGVKTIPLDIRIIAATNRNLGEMVKNKEFREDLWFRLDVFPILIPPLRERTIDIPSLVQHFVSVKSRDLKLPSIPKLSPGCMDNLLGYSWPGNVRELQNVIERALILNPKGPLRFDHMGIQSSKETSNPRMDIGGPDNLDDVISRHIQHVLNKANGRVNGPKGAAGLLGVNPSTLRNRMKRMRIEYGKKGKA